VTHALSGAGNAEAVPGAGEGGTVRALPAPAAKAQLPRSRPSARDKVMRDSPDA
jgi:hypothetical protein